jgi:hypothetical protein
MSVATVPTPVVTIAWWQSKIVWAGVVSTLLGAIPIVQSALPQLIGAANPVDLWTGILGVIAGVSTVVFRIWFTTSQIS